MIHALSLYLPIRVFVLFCFFFEILLSWVHPACGCQNNFPKLPSPRSWKLKESLALAFVLHYTVNLYTDHCAKQHGLNLCSINVWIINTLNNPSSLQGKVYFLILTLFILHLRLWPYSLLWGIMASYSEALSHVDLCSDLMVISKINQWGGVGALL